MKGLLAALVLVATSDAEHHVVKGAVVDVLPRHTSTAADAAVELWASVGTSKGRHLERLFPSTGEGARLVAVPRTATFVAACPDAAGVDVLQFVDDRGVVAADGARVLTTRPLTRVPDPAQLFVADLCPRALPGEMRLPVEEGVLVRAPDGATTTLPFDHRARAFSGRMHRGFRPARTYAAAVSLYAPRLYDVDVDGDGALDLVVSHEERMVVFPRRDGKLSKDLLVEIDLVRALGLKSVDDVDLRTLVGDVDGDRRADLVIGVTAGALPERSSTWLLSTARGGAPLGARAQVLDGEGLIAPLAVVTRRGAPHVLFADVDTSMMSLGAVLLSGSVDVQTSLRDASGARRKGPVLGAAVDVRRARMVGALPIADVDLDGDGVSDLFDVGIPGRAFVYRGTAEGYETSPAFELSVPTFEHIVSLKDERVIVLVGSPDVRSSLASTRVAIVRGERFTRRDDARGPRERGGDVDMGRR